ncbi:MAG: sugar ABC transporter substrate-binding protein [Nitrospirales bacterium]|nr:sugar ABC transporter substrate-binding protein [Nitrospirales bacterium]
MPSFAFPQKILLSLLGVLCLLIILNIFIQLHQFEDHKKHMAVFLPGSVKFFSIETRAMDQEAKRLDIDLVTFNAGWDPYVQIEQVENVLLGKTFDAIALCSVDNQAMSAIIKLIREKSIPFVTFTNGVGHTQNQPSAIVNAHIGRDELKAGQILGKAVELLARDTPINIVLIEGAPGTAPQRFREKGFLDSFDAHKDHWTLIEKLLIPGWNIQIVAREIQRMVDEKTLGTVIVTQWAEAAVAVVHILQKNKIKDIKVVTLEFTQDVKNFMHTGDIQYATYSSIAEEGQKVIQTVQKLMDGEHVNFFIEIPQVLVTPGIARGIVPEW